MACVAAARAAGQFRSAKAAGRCTVLARPHFCGARTDGDALRGKAVDAASEAAIRAAMGAPPPPPERVAAPWTVNHWPPRELAPRAGAAPERNRSVLPQPSRWPRLCHGLQEDDASGANAANITEVGRRRARGGAVGRGAADLAPRPVGGHRERAGRVRAGGHRGVSSRTAARRTVVDHREILPHRPLRAGPRREGRETASYSADAVTARPPEIIEARRPRDGRLYDRTRDREHTRSAPRRAAAAPPGAKLGKRHAAQVLDVSVALRPIAGRVQRDARRAARTPASFDEYAATPRPRRGSSHW